MCEVEELAMHFFVSVEMQLVNNLLQLECLLLLLLLLHGQRMLSYHRQTRHRRTPTNLTTPMSTFFSFCVFSGEILDNFNIIRHDLKNSVVATDIPQSIDAITAGDSPRSVRNELVPALVPVEHWVSW